MLRRESAVGRRVEASVAGSRALRHEGPGVKAQWWPFELRIEGHTALSLLDVCSSGPGCSLGGWGSHGVDVSLELRVLSWERSGWLLGFRGSWFLGSR